ncbi:MAG: 50S ribosomal protein L3 [Verrucomicrobia bacterium GWC2_42_7]|nr:MAG: 50S ribosomal protein L3 [Verrucomicrobia bacterium GWC2_42_7]
MNLILLGKKIGMTQVFDKDNHLIPVTVIQAGPCPVTQIKTKDRDGYDAIQIGYRSQKESRLAAPELGHLKKAGVAPVSELREVRVEGAAQFQLGELLTVTKFSEGSKVDIIGVSKGHGFQGVVRRFSFDGGPASHGSMFHRRGGSYGMRQTPGHVFKNKKMPGRMGNDRITVQNLDVIRIVEDKNIILVRGSVPGCNGGLVMVRESKKSRVKKA